jgi:uncharacterized protein (DUF58 family)
VTPASRRPRALRSLPVVGGLLRAYEDRLTARGRALFWAVLVLGGMGVDTRRSQVYVLFAIALGALLLAVLGDLFPRPRAILECALPARATALVPVTFRARVKSAKGHLPELRFAIPRPLRWGSSVRFSPEESFLAVAPDATTDVPVTLTVQRRGRYELRGPTLRRTDPLRLATGLAVAAPPQTLLVYPRFFRFDSFPVPLGRRYQPGGIPLSSNTGDAIEFVGTRDYREGDAIKNIHWRSWARRGKPVVKEYQEEYFSRVALILDTFVPEKTTAVHERVFESAVSVLSSVADHFSRSEAIVDILAAGPDVYQVSTGRSLAYLDTILDVLACLEPCRDRPFSTIGPLLFDKLAQTTTVVAVLQDWDEPREAFLRQVRDQGTAVRAVIVHAGPTTRPWEAAGADIGVVSLMTPDDVDRALAAHASTPAAPAAGDAR